MYETYGATDVSLNVRQSNKAALALYQSTLGFTNTGVDKKYYGDGEDAFCMKKQLDYFRHETADAESDDEDDGAKDSLGKDEGDAVGSMGKADDTTNGDVAERMRKVKIGRQLGVGELVERNESSK